MNINVCGVCEAPGADTSFGSLDQLELAPSPCFS
jgi:hypothetical protein